jgi:hypothetical protein
LFNFQNIILGAKEIPIFEGKTPGSAKVKKNKIEIEIGYSKRRND